MSHLGVPYIPESAPFSVEQRRWLNGLLTDLFSNALPATAKAALQVSVLFASQGGTAERLAKRMVKLLKQDGHSASVHSLEKVTPAELAQMQHAVLFASTYGEGDPPDSARTFYDALFADNAPRLNGLRYSIFCLGDRNYENFCSFGIQLDERIAALGAARVYTRIESDVDVDDPFAAWSTQILAHLAKQPSMEQISLPAVAPAAVITSEPTRDNPFHAELVDKRLLTDESSSKQTVHVSFDLAEGEMSYEAGDACGVLAQNDPAVVAEILELLPFSASDTFTIPKVGTVRVDDALKHHLQPTCLTRKTIIALAERAQCQTLLSLLAPENSEDLEAYIRGRGLIDLLHAYPGILKSPADLAEVLPRLAPRLYSISSSPKAHGRELHCTIAVVRYHAHDRKRGGVASTMLADRMDVGSRVPIYVQRNKRFRLPPDSSAPIIMIGPGTGIAPFRAFLHERRALGHQGKNWLFFGERSAHTDFLYRRELRQFMEEGHLTRLDTAFSRDQAHKVYVQDRMIEAGAELYQWLQNGASVYVCGDASRMAKDVDAALHRIVETHGQLSTDAAQEYVSELNEHHRYHRDVY